MRSVLKIKNSYLINLPAIKDKKRGNLCFAEISKHIPFAIKRIYWIFSTPVGVTRGGHAHKHNEQVLFCLNGAIKINLDDGHNRKTINLSRVNHGIYIGKMVWHTMTYFKKNTILLVVASRFFEEKDYIRDYNLFKNITKNDFI